MGKQILLGQERWIARRTSTASMGAYASTKKKDRVSKWENKFFWDKRGGLPGGHQPHPWEPMPPQKRRTEYPNGKTNSSGTREVDCPEDINRIHGSLCLHKKEGQSIQMGKQILLGQERWIARRTST